MYVLTLLTVLAAPGQLPGWCSDSWCGSGYEHGYGSFWPVPNHAGGIVRPPAWPHDLTPWWASKLWYEYAMQLDGYEREDAIRVWQKATPCARKRLLAKLPILEEEAARYRDQVERERALERYRIENRPMSAEEIEVFESYYLRLRGAARKEARYRWRGTDNRGRRLYIKEILREEEMKELIREDQKDDEDEVEIQKEKAKKEKDEKKKDKEDKDKKDKEDKEKKDKEEKDKKDKEDKDKKKDDDN